MTNCTTSFLHIFWYILKVHTFQHNVMIFNKISWLWGSLQISFSQVTIIFALVSFWSFGETFMVSVPNSSSLRSMLWWLLLFFSSTSVKNFPWKKSQFFFFFFSHVSSHQRHLKKVNVYFFLSLPELHWTLFVSWNFNTKFRNHSIKFVGFMMFLR